jgi:pimeloyl-ACP methyl ester carboxylesterase
MKTVTSKDGTKIAYDTYGSGPALIYITGASCFRNFMPVSGDAKAFSKAFTVYNYDRRGRGDSGNTLPYSIDREVEDIEAMVEAAGGTAFLYGHSSGAVLALESALKLGDKIRKVVIYDASYVHDETEKKEYRQLSEVVEALLKSGKNAKAMKVFLQGIGMPKPFVALLPLFPGWSTMKALAPTLMYDIALTANLPSLKRLASIETPTQVIVGEKSPEGLHDVASQIADAIPHATLVRMKGQDHMVSSKVLMPHLSRFLK